LLVFSLFAFFNSYPPGTPVIIWSHTGGGSPSTWISIILTAGIPLLLGIGSLSLEAVMFIRTRLR
jgi:hypothetical protein